MTSVEMQERSLVIACTSLCVVAAAVGWLIYPGELTLPLALGSLIPPLCVAVARAKRNGVVDPLAVFALSFAAYNGVLLVRFNYGRPEYEALAPTAGTFFHAGILSALGSLGLVAGWLVSKDRHSDPVSQGSASQCTASFVTGIGFYMVGVALYMAQYWQIGGYMQSVGMDRGQRFELLKHTVSMPYEGFVLCGIALMIYGSLGVSKTRVMLAFVACAVWLGLVLLQGDRRLALQMIMATGVVIGTLRPRLTKLRVVVLVSVAAAYFVAVLFGQYRTLIYDLASGRSTLNQAKVAAEGQESIMGKPEQSELGGPYVSVLYYSDGGASLRWGSSYAMSIPAVLPRALYPGTKTPAISADLDQALYQGVGPVYGLGFSPIAEAYVNFGLAGPFGVMVLWSMFFAWLGSNRHGGLAGMIVCATLLQEAVNSNRIDFRYVYFESVYCAGVVPVALITMRVVAGITSRGATAVRVFPLAPQFIAVRRNVR